MKWLLMMGICIYGYGTSFMETFPELIHPYATAYEQFVLFRDELSSYPSLYKQCAKADKEEKWMYMLPREGWVLKKRRRDNVNEVWTWELSCLLGTGTRVLPAFVLEMGDNAIVAQQMERFVFGEKKTKIPPRRLLRSVSVGEYWKAFLMAYILGFHDLVGRNIGITPQGQIIFFDTESAFRYDIETKRVGPIQISCAFIAQAFDWPQAQMILRGQDLLGVQEFVSELSLFKERIERYVQGRTLVFSLEQILERVQTVEQFFQQAWQHEVCFYDFYAFIEPRFMQGFSELCVLLSSIMERDVALGSALFFLSRQAKRYKLSHRDQEKLHAWIEKYVDEEL